jgi:hypothetical protein
MPLPSSENLRPLKETYRLVSSAIEVMSDLGQQNQHSDHWEESRRIYVQLLSVQTALANLMAGMPKNEKPK